MTVKNIQRVAVMMVLLVISGSVLKSLAWFSLPLWRVEMALGGDKMVHVIFSYLCALSVLLGFCTFDKPYLARLSRWVLLLVLAFTVDEALQRFIPSREFSWTDLSSNLIGIFAALLSWFWVNYCFLLKQKKEQQHGLH